MLETLNAIKEYAPEAAKSLIQALDKINIKEAKGQGEFEVIATTDGIDRDGEVIKVEGWKFENYLKNPIILWGHNYYSLESIIGAATEIKVETGKVVIKGVFANTESGQLARQLYDDGILKAVSVGFIPLQREGNVITEAELLELSFVSVPANPDAITLAKFFKLEKHLLLKSDNGQNEEEEAKALETEKVEKSGRVLSSKNRELIQSCADTMAGSVKLLKELLDASEPEKEAIIELAKEARVSTQHLQKAVENAIRTAKLLESKL